MQCWYYYVVFFLIRSVPFYSIVVLYSGNLATKGTDDQLDPCLTMGAPVVAPPGLDHGNVNIAVGGAHYLVAKVVS